MLDLVLDRREMKATLGQVLTFMTPRTAAANPTGN
jgi:acetyl-CoA carboxylase beta subunit